MYDFYLLLIYHKTVRLPLNLKNEFGMIKLLAKCPNCEDDSLYCGRIPTSIKTLANKEVLFCKNCKFVVTVDEYKKMLFQA